MTVAIRLALIATLTMLSSCKNQKPVDHPPPTTTCTNCQWENFLNRPLRVRLLECTNEGKPEKCHLTTENGEPVRNVIVTRDPATGAFNWKLDTPSNPDERMECLNLAPDLNDKRVIGGTCIISDSDQGPAAHFFRAVIAPMETDPTKGAVSAQFRHSPITNHSRPVHDGSMHLD